MKLTHVDKAGKAEMVDIGAKQRSSRVAVAQVAVHASKLVLNAIVSNSVKKGDVLAAARLAGVQAAKRTPDWIPLCHPVALTKITVTIDVELTRGRVVITTEARAKDRTGVEMEALTAAAATALTVYDMCKSLDKTMRITDLVLLEKRGGKSGTFIRSKALRKKN
jgi:cyclic pyranopterin phosphate synthase